MAAMAEHKFYNDAYGGSLSNSGMSGQSQGNWVLNFGGGSAQAASGGELSTKTMLILAAAAAGVWWLVKKKKI